MLVAAAIGQRVPVPLSDTRLAFSDCKHSEPPPTSKICYYSGGVAFSRRPVVLTIRFSLISGIVSWDFPSENPGQAFSHRLHSPGVLALGDRSHKVPEPLWLQFFEGGLSVDPPTRTMPWLKNMKASQKKKHLTI